MQNVITQFSTLYFLSRIILLQRIFGLIELNIPPEAGILGLVAEVEEVGEEERRTVRMISDPGSVVLTPDGYSDPSKIYV